MNEFKELLGKTLIHVEQLEDEMIFDCSDATKYRMYHEQDCCEDVTIEDITGDLQDLLGHPILLAEEVVEEADTEYGSETWTFYKLSTVKGSVTIRWYGESNGYYSESVDFERIR